MKRSFYLSLALCSLSASLFAQTVNVRVDITNISPDDGVTITPPWVGFHSGSFDSYNGGLVSLEGLERLAEDGDTSLLSTQFNDFDPTLGGYTYIDNSGTSPASALVRTGDLRDQYRVDATLPSAGPPPLQPGESVSQEFTIRTDGSNRFFSYVSMVLPTNDFFIANGNPLAHDLMSLYDGEGTIEFFVGTPNGGVNDAGTERENFAFSAGNGLFPDRNLPPGQRRPNQGPESSLAISNVVGNAFADFPGSNGRGFDLSGLDFNSYESGIARISISAVPSPGAAAAVPEPTTALLGGAGLVMLLGMARRRRSR